MELANSTKPQKFLNRLIQMLYAKAGQRNDGIEQDPTSNLVIVDDANDIEFISKRPDIFTKNYSAISMMGISRFNSDGEEWSKRRDITQSSFNSIAHSRNVTPIHDEYVETLLRHTPANATQLQTTLFEASLCVFNRAFGGSGPTSVLLPHINELRAGLRWLQYLSWVGSGQVQAQQQVAAIVKATLQKLVNELENDSGFRPMWQHFSGAGLEIKGYNPIEELVMNMFAGIETTVSTLGWTIDRLAVNQSVQDRIFDEVSSGAADLPYCECLINEAMRYFPPIPFLIKNIEKPVTLAGKPADQSNLALISIIGLHRNREYWHDPDTFDSARAEFLDGTYNRRAFVPFFVGPRICGGMKLARIELLQGLKAFVQHFKVARNDSPVHFDYTLAMRPVDQGQLQIEHRRTH